MKRKQLTYLLMVVMLGSIACKKGHLDTAPTDQVPDDQVFNSTTNAAIALNGIHRIMWTQYFNQDEAGQASMMINIDNLGEDLINNSTAAGAFFNSMYRWEAPRNANSTQMKFAYFFYYKLIANANAILASIDAATGPDAEKKIIKGESLVYRAFAHFMLVQLYGKRYDATAKPNNSPGVPLLLTPTLEPQARSTVEEVYTQVNKDLDDAITNLTGYTRAYKSHFNVSVAKGIKARVALVQQDYANAAKFSAEARTGFTLMTTAQYTDGFNDAANPEWMWASIIPADQGTFFYSFFAYMSNFSSNATRTNPRSINSNLYAAITSTDIRKGLWVPGGVTPPASGTKFPYTSTKFKVKDINISIGDVPYMRVAEMYLIEAEAQARQNKNTEAQDVLFTLAKKRDTGYVKSVNTGQALIDEIMIQRRVELWGEGHRFTDLKRLNLPLDRSGANHNSTIAVVLSVPAGDKRWQWLIPRDEINANSKVEQNPL